MSNILSRAVGMVNIEVLNHLSRAGGIVNKESKMATEFMSVVSRLSKKIDRLAEMLGDDRATEVLNKAEKAFVAEIDRAERGYLDNLSKINK